jgi:protein-tyrosine kinase
MSKLFDKVQKASAIDHAPERAGSDLLRKIKDKGQGSVGHSFPTGKPEIEPLFETVKQANTTVAELAEFRLERCRKVELAATSETLVFLDSDRVNLATEAYRSLRTRLLRIQHTRGMRSIVVTSSARDEGKTLTLMNLALCLTQLPTLRILLVDADIRTAGLSRLLGNPAGPGLAQVLAGEVEYNEAIVSTNVPNLYAIAAGRSTQPAGELFAKARWKEFLGWSSECFSLVLVDSPPVLLLADFELIVGACDGVLLVVRALTTQRELLKKAASQIEKRKLLGAVFFSAATTRSIVGQHAEAVKSAQL